MILLPNPARLLFSIQFPVAILIILGFILIDTQVQSIGKLVMDLNLSGLNRPLLPVLDPFPQGYKQRRQITLIQRH